MQGITACRRMRLDGDKFVDVLRAAQDEINARRQALGA